LDNRRCVSRPVPSRPTLRVCDVSIRELEPIEILLYFVESVVTDLIVRTHRENRAARGAQGGAMQLLVRGPRKRPRVLAIEREAGPESLAQELRVRRRVAGDARKGKQTR
jgi:hypothetical protein